MYLAQVAAFLISHHHAMWVPGLFASAERAAWLAAWARHHGFVFQP
jgi:hypothetical protein